MFSPNDAVVSGFKYQVSVFVLLVSLSVSSNIWSAEPIDVTTAIENFSQRMATEHGFSKESIDNLINGAKKKESILNAFSKPATSKPWSFFQKLYVTEFREKEGVKFWNKHLNLLLKAESEFGVPPEIITALIGIETNYGGYTGEFSIVDAFYTLGFYGERRNKYFLKEFEEFLLLARENGMDPLSIKGSFAGAIGIAQFMPSSYREYAIDFDGDGKADLEHSVADAIGSASNYLKRHGWVRGKPIVHRLTQSNISGLYDFVGKSKPRITMSELRRAGYEGNIDIDDDVLVGLFKLEGADGIEYWISEKNFYVITRYNPSNNYAMAICQLAEKIKALRAQQ